MFFFGCFARIVDRGLDEAVSDLFTFPFVQSTDPINFLDELLILLNVGWSVFGLIFVLRFISVFKHGKLKHLILNSCLLNKKILRHWRETEGSQFGFSLNLYSAAYTILYMMEISIGLNCFLR